MGLTPDYSIAIDGMVVTDNLRKHLTSLRITDEAGWQNDTVDIELAGENLALPKMGARLSVSLGYKETGLVHMGVYVINAITLKGPPHKVLIKGHGADFNNAMKAKITRSWPNTTVGEIVEDIGNKHGYKAAVSHELANKPITHLDQTNESDLHLLTRLAHSHHATAKPAGGHLLFVPKNAVTTASGKMLNAFNIRLSDTLQYHHSSNERSGDKKLQLTLAGNARLRAEMPLNFLCDTVDIPTQWAISQVTHNASDRGFTTQLTAASDSSSAT